MAPPPIISIRNSSLKSKSFNYNFNTHGGAIGSIPMGIFLPAPSQIISIALIPQDDLISAGAAIVNILVGGATYQIIDNAQQGIAGDYTDYNLGTFGFGLTLINTQFSNGLIPSRFATKIIQSPAEILLEISAFALTAGNFIGTIQYNEFY